MGLRVDTPSNPERYFVLNPTASQENNIFNDWADLFAAIDQLEIGEIPVVTFVTDGITPVVVPLAGMPVTGWNMKGGRWQGYIPDTGKSHIQAPVGVLIDMLFGISNGLHLEVSPADATGVLQFTGLPLGSGWIFIIGEGALVTVNNPLGALIRSPGGVPSTTMVIALGVGAQQNSFFPPSPGPLLELTGDDGAVSNQTNTVGGLPSNWLKGGGPGSNQISIYDGTGTRPNQWVGFSGGGFIAEYSNLRPAQGDSANRPVDGFGNPIGMIYFDTTLGIPIWWNGAAWVDATGAIV